MTVQIAAQPSATRDPSTSPQGGSELQLGPREQVDLATKGLQLADVTAKPGTLVPVSVTSSTGGTTVVSVPVLPAVDYYATDHAGPDHQLRIRAVRPRLDRAVAGRCRRGCRMLTGDPHDPRVLGRRRQLASNL